MKARFLLTAAFLAMVASPAAAAWKEARSTHFIVYSEGSEERIRKTISDLEKYTFMLRFMTKAKPVEKPIPVKVYLLDNVEAVGASSPGGGGMAGYYSASPRGPFAISTRAASGGREGLTAQEVLFHELAHHFMFQHFPAAYPSWYSEGFADYYGSARIKDNDMIEVGHGVANRYLSLSDNSWLPAQKLLTARSYADVGGRLHLLYSEGWLLTHYLAQNKERAAQLGQYLTAINSGQSYEDATTLAFGAGAKQLDSELRSYSRKSRIMAMVLPFKPIDVGPIAFRTLSGAEDAMLWQDMTLARGLLQREAKKFVETVRDSARKYPADPYALRLLTEAERAAGNAKEAAAAVDQWLAAKPNDPLALMHKAELELEGLKVAGSPDSNAWEAARQRILAANKLAPREPQILLAYYESFAMQGLLPPAHAQNALVRAFNMIPQAETLRYMVAADYEARGMLDEAIAVIKPAAYELHNEDDPEKKKKQEELRAKYREADDHRTETARDMLERLERKRSEKAEAAQ